MRRKLAVAIPALAALLVGLAPPPPQTFYQSTYVISGTSAERRDAGFQEAFRRLLVKVSGDRRLADDPKAADIILHAADYVASFDYLDLMSAMPKHDEQGTYDRPQYLTVTFDQAKVDKALAKLRHKPWVNRPRLVVFLGVHLGANTHVVEAGETRDEAMRESAANASRLYDVPILFPAAATIAANLPTYTAAFRANPVDLDPVAKTEGGDVALVGTLDWSDADLGWIADWTIAANGRPVHWQKRGINFDEAFRDGLSGAALVLSGNGLP